MFLEKSVALYTTWSILLHLFLTEIETCPQVAVLFPNIVFQSRIMMASADRQAGTDEKDCAVFPWTLDNFKKSVKLNLNK